MAGRKKQIAAINCIATGGLRGFLEGGRTGQTSLDILARQVWEIGQHFLEAPICRGIMRLLTSSPTIIGHELALRGDRGPHFGLCSRRFSFHIWGYA